MNQNLKEQDVLVVAEKGSNKLNVVTGINEDGTPKTTLPKQENEPDFLKIDKHADALENFMSNFMRQCKDPTHFNFFKVPADQVDKVVPVLQEMLKDPDNPSNKEILDTHRVLPEAFSVQKYQAIDESKVDWEQLGKLGVTKEMLVESKSLDKMLNWQKSNVLIPINVDIDGMKLRTEARLSFRENADGKLTTAIHALKSQPELDKPFFRTNLTDDDKSNLLKTGHAGRLIELEPVKDQKMLAYVSIDKMTNELVAVRADKIKIPDEVKGVKLTEENKKLLSEGKSIYVEGMTAKSGKEFNATLQINADSRRIAFRFDQQTREQAKEQAQNKTQNQTQRVFIPTRLLGAEISKEQQKDLKENKTIYVEGMTDRKGELFNAYIKVNTEKQKLDFYPSNPDKAQSITPDNASKTQVAVNSEGKTNESTKNLKEPLKQGQTQPTAEQTQKQEEQKELKKSTSIKR